MRLKPRPLFVGDIKTDTSANMRRAIVGAPMTGRLGPFFIFSEY
jgi:hypothetical protein